MEKIFRLSETEVIQILRDKLGNEDVPLKCELTVNVENPDFEGDATVTVPLKFLEIKSGFAL